MKYSGRMVVDQALGSVINEVNVQREDIKNEAIAAVERIFAEGIKQQDYNFLSAMQEIERVRNFLGDPSKIIGSPLTKHGEIAEQVEVGIGNAKQIIKGLPERFSFEGVGRTAPEDYIMDRIKVQSKFFNGENNTLTAVIEHLKRYKDIDFGRDGSKYVIPKDFHETINKILNGQSIDEFNKKSVCAIKDKINEIETITGKDFNDVVNASISDYKDVQQGAVIKVVDKYEQEISNENIVIKRDLKKEADHQKNDAIIKGQPNINEALKVTAISAAIEGTLQTALIMYKKQKNLRNYTTDDWKEVGFVFAEGTGKGAIRGVSIYALTNYATMPAPLAASFVSACFGVSNIYSSFKKGNISAADMVEQGEILCFHTTLNLLGSTMGQTLIPIPVLGAVIGSITANVLGGILKEKIEADEKEIMRLSKVRYEESMKLLDDKLAKDVEKLVKQMLFMWGLSRMAFNFEMNAALRFEASQKLASAHGVSQNKILKSDDDISRYFMD